MVHVILLGVGTAVPDKDRGHTHLVWTGSGNGPLLVDAGGATYQRLLVAGVDPQELQGIVLTHSHADHINGLPAVLFSLSLAGRRTELPIYGMLDTLTLVERMVDACGLDEHTPPVSWCAIEPGDMLDLGDSWLVHTTQTQHSRPCLALRFENISDHRALTYSCDTAPCQEIVDLARGSHTLIHEATVAEPMDAHTTPREAGDIAARAGVSSLVLVHYSPRWTMPEAQALADIQASGFMGRAEIGREYQVIPV